MSGNKPVEKITYLMLKDDHSVLVGLEDIGELLKCSVVYVRKLIRKFHFPAACIDGKYYSIKSEVVKWIIDSFPNKKIRLDKENILKNMSDSVS